MRAAAAGLFLTLAACGAPPREPATPRVDPSQVVPAGPQTRDDHIVAFLDGQPIAWREVTEHAMEAGGRQLIDQYITWRLRRDAVKNLHITNTPEDLRARAQIIIDLARRTQGDDKVQSALKEQGMTEAQYVERFVGDPLFGERLLAEKAFAYAMLTQRSIDLETIAFTDEGDAAAFIGEVAKGALFEKTAEALLAGGTKGRVSQWPRRRLARGYLPPLIAHLEEKLFLMKEGETTGLERAQNNLVIVAHVAKTYAASAVPYEQLRGQVMEQILREPPGEEQMKMWMDRLFRGSKIQYEDRYTTRNKVR